MAWVRYSPWLSRCHDHRAMRGSGRYGTPPVPEIRSRGPSPALPWFAHASAHAPGNPVFYLCARQRPARCWASYRKADRKGCWASTRRPVLASADPDCRPPLLASAGERSRRRDRDGDRGRRASHAGTWQNACRTRSSAATAAAGLTLDFFFTPGRIYLQRALPVGEERVVSGRIRHYGNELQITHPDHIGTGRRARYPESRRARLPTDGGIDRTALAACRSDQRSTRRLICRNGWNLNSSRDAGAQGWKDALLARARSRVAG